MITRDEFDELAGEAISAGGNMASALEWGEGVQSSFDAAGKARDDLMAAFDTMNKRIAELEAQVSAWPRVPEADEERDECAVLEMSGVLAGVNLLDEEGR